MENGRDCLILPANQTSEVEWNSTVKTFFYWYSQSVCQFSYLNSEKNRRMARTATNIFWIKVGVRLAHERGLQNVATLTILHEFASI